MTLYFSIGTIKVDGTMPSDHEGLNLKFGTQPKY